MSHINAYAIDKLDDTHISILQSSDDPKNPFDCEKIILANKQVDLFIEMLREAVAVKEEK